MNKLLSFLFLLTLSHAARSQCLAPALIVSNGSSTCSEQGVLTVTVTPNLLQGCMVDSTNGAAFKLYKDFQFLQSSVTNTFVIPNPDAGEYRATVRIKDNGTGLCPCANAIGAESQLSNAVTVYPTPPPPSLLNDTYTVCPGNSTLIQVANPQPGFNYIWKDGMGNALATGNAFNTPPIFQDIDYFLFLERNGCESLTGEMVTIVVEALTAPWVADDSLDICTGQALLLTAYNTAVDYPTANLIWYEDPTLTTVLNVGNTYYTGPINYPSTYYIVAQFGNCISDYSTIVITPSLLPTPQINGAFLICTGTTTMLTASGSTGQYYWYSDAALTQNVETGINFTTPALTQDATYWLVARDNGCESQAFSFTVHVQPFLLPTPQINSPAVICPGQTAVLTASGASGQYNWYSDAALTQNVEVGINFTTPPLTQDATYWLQANDNGCLSQSTSSTVLVDAFQLPTPQIDAPLELCEGENAQLTASGSSGQYYWYSDSLLTQNIQVGIHYATPILTHDTSFWLVARDNGCRSLATSALIQVHALPIAPAIETNSPLCEGDTIALSAPGLVAGFALDWSGPAGFSSFQTAPTVPNATFDHNQGNYNLIVTDALTGCSSLPTSILVMINRGPVISLEDIVNMHDGDSISLTCAGGDVYEWTPHDYLLNFNSGEPSFYPPRLSSYTTVEYTYYVKVTESGQNCSSIDSILVRVEPAEDITVYDVVTPNGDEKNDQWVIKGLYNASEYKIYLFDTHNQLIWQHLNPGDNPYMNTWDGSNMKGELLPTGAYKYVIETPLANIKIRTGMISVIRE